MRASPAIISVSRTHSSIRRVLGSRRSGSLSSSYRRRTCPCTFVALETCLSRPGTAAVQGTQESGVQSEDGSGERGGRRTLLGDARRTFPKVSQSTPLRYIPAANCLLLCRGSFTATATATVDHRMGGMHSLPRLVLRVATRVAIRQHPLPDSRRALTSFLLVFLQAKSHVLKRLSENVSRGFADMFQP